MLRRTFGDEEEGEAGPRGALRRAVLSLAEWRDFATPWHRPVIDRRALIETAMTAIHEFADLSAKGSKSDNLRIDTAYAENWSLVLDLAILRKTFAAALRGNGAP